MNNNHRKVKIRVKELDLFYHDIQALSSVSMDINKNEVTALIGPTNSGKSSFIRTLNRMIETRPGAHITGQVIYEGKDVYRDYRVREIRKKIGMIFDKPNPFPMSAYDNVAYGPKIHGIGKKEILDEIVEQSMRKAMIWNELKDRLHKSAYGLSGGQVQRLCVARVLAVEPEVLLMDEPTAALDPISTGRMEDLIEELKNNYTIVMATNNMQQAGRISDSTAFFLDGVIEEQGITGKLFFSPENRKTEAYLTGKFG
jgi:phosphate transport system ATP-binding protein